MSFALPTPRNGPRTLSRPHLRPPLPRPLKQSHRLPSNLLIPHPLLQETPQVAPKLLRRPAPLPHQPLRNVVLSSSPPCSPALAPLAAACSSPNVAAPPTNHNTKLPPPLPSPPEGRTSFNVLLSLNGLLVVQQFELLGGDAGLRLDRGFDVEDGGCCEGWVRMEMSRGGCVGSGRGWLLLGRRGEEPGRRGFVVRLRRGRKRGVRGRVCCRQLV